MAALNGFSHGSISISPIYIQYTAYAHTIALDLFEENGVRTEEMGSGLTVAAIDYSKTRRVSAGVWVKAEGELRQSLV